MGWVPPPAPRDPAARAEHRAFLVKVLGYDPAIEPRPRWQTLRYIRWQTLRYILRSLR